MIPAIDLLAVQPALVLALEKGLFEILALLVFLLAPLWKKALEARQKKAGDKPSAAKRAAPQRTVARQGGSTGEATDEAAESLWDALLRGELPSPQVAPEPAPVPVQRAPQPSPAQPAIPLREALAKPLGGLQSTFAASTSTLSTEGIGASADHLGESITGRRPRATRPGPHAGHDHLAAGGWRRAVILREVLGKPVALRGGSTDGPPGW